MSSGAGEPAYVRNLLLAAIRRCAGRLMWVTRATSCYTVEQRSDKQRAGWGMQGRHVGGLTATFCTRMDRPNQKMPGQWKIRVDAAGHSFDRRTAEPLRVQADTDQWVESSQAV